MMWKLRNIIKKLWPENYSTLFRLVKFCWKSVVGWGSYLTPAYVLHAYLFSIVQTVAFV